MTYLDALYTKLVEFATIFNSEVEEVPVFVVFAGDVCTTF